MNIQGLAILLVIIAFPVLALAAPLASVWLSRNKDTVNARVENVRASIEDLRERRDAAYESDESALEDNDEAADEAES